MSCRGLLSVIWLIGLLGSPGASNQANGRERIPEVAQLANGRIIEVSGHRAVLRLRGNTAGLSDSELMRLEFLSSETELDLSQAEGTAYFVAEDEEMSLARAWSRMRPGQVVEIAAAEQGRTTIRRVRGTTATDSDPRTRPGLPGTRDPLSMFSRRSVQRIVVSGPIYVWVLGAEGGA